MAPTLMECPVPSCTFLTRENIPSYELIIKALELHTRFGHPELHQEGGDSRTTTNRAKPKELPRPTVDEEITDQEWNHFKVKWA